MKKYLLFLSLILASSSLISCKKEEAPEEVKEPINYLKYNIDEISSYRKERNFGKLTYEKINLPSNIVWSEVVSDCRSLIKVRNSSGFYGLYNAVYNEMLIKCMFDSPSFFELITDYYEEAYFILFDIGKESYLIDSAGTIVYQGEKITSKDVTISIEEDVIFISVKDIHKFYVYDNFKLTEKSKVIESELEDSIEKYTEDLSIFGLDGYRMNMSANNIVTIYNDKNEVFNTYYLPLFGSHTSTFELYGNSILIQTAEPLNNNATEYSFEYFLPHEENSIKVLVETNLYDILTGESRTVDFDYLIDGSKSINDENGDKSLVIVEGQRFKDGLLTSESVEHILDTDLNLVQDVSGIGFTDFEKVGNLIFNDDSGIIFDENLEITDNKISGMVREVFKNKKLIVVCDNSTYRYGVIDFDGNLVVPTVYEYIILDERSPHFLGVGRTFIDEYDASTMKKIRTISDIESFNTQYHAEFGFGVTYKTKTTNEFVVMDLSGNSFILEDSYSEFCGISYDLACPRAFLVEDLDFENYVCVIENDLKLVNQFGTEKSLDSDTLDGSNIFQAIELNLGQNKIANHQSGETIVKFTPTKTGSYNFGDGYDLINEISTYNNQERYETFESDYDYNYVLFKDITYYITLISSSEINFELKLISEIKESDGKNLTITTVEGHQDASGFILKPTQSGYYEFKSDKNSEFSVYGVINKCIDSTISLIKIDEKNYFPLSKGCTYYVAPISLAAEEITITDVILNEEYIGQFSPQAGFHIDKENNTATTTFEMGTNSIIYHVGLIGNLTFTVSTNFADDTRCYFNICSGYKTIAKLSGTQTRTFTLPVRIYGGDFRFEVKIGCEASFVQSASIYDISFES